MEPNRFAQRVGSALALVVVVCIAATVVAFTFATIVALFRLLGL